MNETDKICQLAKLGFKIAQPKGYKPHAVERLFRESVKPLQIFRASISQIAITGQQSQGAYRRPWTEWARTRHLFPKGLALMPKQMSSQIIL